MDADGPRARLCHMRKRPDFAGYGFNLYAEKGRNGQFIGKVDPGSPAELAGLRQGDRIVEVNGVNVGNENHQQVVQRIKAVADETKFLVVDSAADQYYRDQKVVIRGDMADVLRLETPHFLGAGVNGIDPKHRPRLCHLRVWPDFTGYGFNLHAEKGKAVQYIGKVDVGSPAEAAGVKEHDRIVEVNGFSVSGEPHQDVVKRIKSDPAQVTLLLVDQEADAYFSKEGITPSARLPSVERIECPSSRPDRSLDKHEVLYRPRLCHIKARDDGRGFGFNMQAEKGKSGQFIGTVDPGSPAEEAGLRDGDRLVEVNGVNVERESHKDVVTRIKSRPGETTLLVIEKEGYEYYLTKGVTVTHALLSGRDSDDEDDHKSEGIENGQIDHHSNDEDDIADEIANIVKNEEKEETFVKDKEKKPDRAALTLNVSSSVSTTGVSSTSHSSTLTPTPLESPKSPVVVGGIEFAGTAEEARRKMSKKRAAKNSNLSAKAKYDLFQKL